MFFRRKEEDAGERTAADLMAVVERTQAIIEFHPDGTIIRANDNFLSAMGYRLEEVVGRHHAMFVKEEYARSPQYKEFWQALGAGKTFTDQFPRVAKDGATVWIQATYAPCLGARGETLSIMKIATDITERQAGIEELARGLDRLSHGELRHRIPPCGAADIHLLGQAFNKACQQLSEVMTSLKGVAGKVEGAAAEIGQSSSELATRTESQAATLEQTASAIDELTSTVKESAESAREVETSASDAMSTARKGGVVVTDAVTAMAEIEASSRRISQVIGIIDDIAFQTNLLALNAGVEAARAGEAGRGFAVVASEVRSLAMRSADSAAEIKDLIQVSSGQVTNGVGLVTRAGDELKRIIEGVEAIHTSVSQIAGGAAEQAAMLEEINAGVSRLDDVTQQNAAMVEESTAASHLLTQEARDLAKRVSVFQTGDQSYTAPVAVPQARRRLAS
ncbi:methyl-accepting chemotaxis protein [Pseudoroseicyclus tamaricis]|nr:methyl-accepting chemotaxis protein [Pseudoroseicyclus tamaricis]